MKARKLALVMIAAAVALVGAVGSWAMAGTRHASPTKVAQVTQAVTTTSTPAKAGTVKTALTSTATDTDSVQSGDQTGTDTPGEVSTETGSSETSTAEEPGDQNLPGGGHADPQGQNAQHEFNGVE